MTMRRVRELAHEHGLDGYTVHEMLRSGRWGARLSPPFVEWMQGLPLGHVTDPAIGISRNAQLTALGNGVVPLQAATAYYIALTDLFEMMQRWRASSSA